MKKPNTSRIITLPSRNIAFSAAPSSPGAKMRAISYHDDPMVAGIRTRSSTSWLVCPLFNQLMSRLLFPGYSDPVFAWLDIAPTASNFSGKESTVCTMGARLGSNRCWTRLPRLALRAEGYSLPLLVHVQCRCLQAVRMRTLPIFFAHRCCRR